MISSSCLVFLLVAIESEIGFLGENYFVKKILNLFLFFNGTEKFIKFLNSE